MLRAQHSQQALLVAVYVRLTARQLEKLTHITPPAGGQRIEARMRTPGR
jgi:hypothetical protein